MSTTGKKALLLFSLIASCAGASTYDAASGFSSSNPSGTWAYGTGVTGSSFTPMTAFTANTCENGGILVSCWQTPVTVNNVPQIAINNSGSTETFSTVVLPTSLLLVHPGPSTDSIVSWTAPAAGTYDISGFFELLDVSPTGVIASVFDGSTQLYTTGALTGPAANEATLTPGGKDTFSLVASLTAGQVLSFGVNNDGDYLNDSTGFDATITSAATPPATTPEPSSVLLLGVGLAAIGVMSRKKLMPQTSRQ